MKKQPEEDWDDGRVIAPMNGDELPAYRRNISFKRDKKRPQSDVTRKEQRKMILAMFQVMLPRFLIILLGFGLAAGVVVLWLL